MTLVESFLQAAGSGNVRELRNAGTETRDRLAALAEGFAPEQAPLKEWNALLTAFGGRAAGTEEEAKKRLLFLLYTADPENGPLPDVPAEQTLAPEKAPAARGRLWRVWNGLTTVLVIAALTLAVLLVGVRAAGLQVFSVLSGSMEPVYHVGSVVYVKKADPSLLKVGDDVTFRMNGKTIVTHRIVEILPQEGDPAACSFRTQGIANRSPDGNLLRSENIIGKTVFSIPYLGAVSDALRQPPGLTIALIAAAVLLFLPELFPEGRRQARRKRRGKCPGNGSDNKTK